MQANLSISAMDGRQQKLSAVHIIQKPLILDLFRYLPQNAVATEPFPQLHYYDFRCF